MTAAIDKGNPEPDLGTQPAGRASGDMAAKALSLLDLLGDYPHGAALSIRLVDTVELTRLGPNTIADREQFRTEIAGVRANGYAIAHEEHETGIRAIGMPILHIGGRLRAAISVAAPAFRRWAEQLTEFLPARRNAADNIKILLPSS